MNKIIINPPIIEKNKIISNFQLTGNWTKCFRKNTMEIEYDCDISGISESLAVIPVLANILPVSWIYDAEVVVNSLDQEFFDSIPLFKRGYQDMYPMLQFLGKLSVNVIEKNNFISDKAAILFSGGVDAFNTLVLHYDENPILVTLWGADVTLDDIKGWENVKKHLDIVRREFNVELISVKSSFHQILNEDILCEEVKESKDDWWHGFQHGLGIYCHVAPVVGVFAISSIYFASSFTIADKGKVTCASDPSIDNYVKFGGASIIHDGYEFNRQMKIHNIVSFVRATGKKVPLRVCWESVGGDNCCSCEKCWRTILGVYAEGEDPAKYGFTYDSFGNVCKKIKHNKDLLAWHKESRYAPMQAVLRKNYTEKSVFPDLKWFYKMDINKLGTPSFTLRIHILLEKIKRKILKR